MYTFCTLYFDTETVPLYFHLHFYLIPIKAYFIWQHFKFHTFCTIALHNLPCKFIIPVKNVWKGWHANKSSINFQWLDIRNCYSGKKNDQEARTRTHIMSNANRPFAVCNALWPTNVVLSLLWFNAQRHVICAKNTNNCFHFYQYLNIITYEFKMKPKALNSEIVLYIYNCQKSRLFKRCNCKCFVCYEKNLEFLTR